MAEQKRPRSYLGRGARFGYLPIDLVLGQRRTLPASRAAPAAEDWGFLNAQTPVIHQNAPRA